MVKPIERDFPPQFPAKEAASHGEMKMGLVYAAIKSTSGDDLALHRRGFLSKDKIKSIKVNALVDRGSYMLVINEHIKEQLDLHVQEVQVARLAGDTEVRAEVVGPIEIRFENRRANVDAVVFPGNVEPLLGAIPMEDLDVVIDLKQQRLIVNPESPYIARKHAKKFGNRL